MALNFKIKISPQERTRIHDIVKDVRGWVSLAGGEFLWHLAANVISSDGEIVEIGSWKGRSAIWLSYGSRAGLGKKIHAVDPHVGSVEHKEKYGPDVDTFADFTANIENAGVSDMVIPVRKSSVDYAREFSHLIELIFIDGDHSYEGVKEDFEAWFPKVLLGGVMVFDDTQDWEGPRRLVREKMFLSNNFKKMGFLGPFTYGVKSSHISLTDKARNRLILFIKDAVWFFLYGPGRVVKIPKTFKIRVKNLLNHLSPS
jgi:predicted O-methyltransferase YrrM